MYSSILTKLGHTAERSVKVCIQVRSGQGRSSLVRSEYSILPGWLKVTSGMQKSGESPPHSYGVRGGAAIANGDKAVM